MPELIVSFVAPTLASLVENAVGGPVARAANTYRGRMRCRLVDVLNAEGDTPLHVAAREGQAQMAQLLIDHGADTWQLTQEGQTPLEIAVAMGRPETVRVLLRAGSHDGLVHEQDTYIVRLALRYDRPEVLDVIAEEQQRWDDEQGCR
ncbi:MAG: ankyrin repeat domain-containing protein [Armatimonadota bacterium]|nr:ankyrin repeat domain-containing protein [Armatimonadota bacterium]